MIEIELKAWVDDPQKTRVLVSTLASFERDFEKEDVYWYPVEKNPAVPNFGVRVRKETDSKGTRVLVTFKVKEKRDTIEVNDEKEFEVSDVEPFEALLNIFGLQVGLRKYKKGSAWTNNDVTAELCEVQGLGWFLELEILVPSADEQTIREAQNRLLSFLKETGVDEGRIESRYYTEMLKVLRK